jgi:L-threonylcarbamoyladenylate synthase
VPDHPLVLDLIRRLGGPITGTSANRSGGAEPVTAADVRAQLGEEVDLVLDGGACGGGASTIVECSRDEVVILRAGAIAEATIRGALTEAGY